MHPRIVVAAAIVHEGRVLAARRSAPAAVAGSWEFPGGKVERDEGEPAALGRECREELGVTVRVGGLLGTSTISDELELRLYRAALVGGEPGALQDHDELRWLAADELTSVVWLCADEPLLPAVRTCLLDS